MTNPTDTTPEYTPAYAAALAALGTILPGFDEAHLWGPADEALADLAAPVLAVRALHAGLWPVVDATLVEATLARAEAVLTAHVDDATPTHAAVTAMIRAIRERG